MIMTLHRETTTVTIATFWESYRLDKYNFSPSFQRESVWDDEKGSFFIDSLLRNYPIPPIFLHQKIDTNTGATLYDVIDGRQRLEAIVKFIKGEIPVSMESGSADDQRLGGSYFTDLDRPELQEYKKHFWRYSLPVEYIDTTSRSVIDSIFDRLNRNGEPLKGQELRHAKYHDTPLMIDIRKLAEHPFWRPWLDKLSVKRMEDIEFVSELVFALIGAGPQESDQDVLDGLYDRYQNSIDSGKLVRDFNAVTNFIEALGLDIASLKIAGPSHLYGLWTFAATCLGRKITPDQVRQPIHNLFVKLRGRNYRDDPLVEAYRRSMSYNTRSRAQRVRRLESLLTACGLA
ncbi:DUF262 domain-containing protein [Azospirillum brasilense]|uniref:DUF262 domain-containing protein n=1 Tax=Azospirillum argentinense TaxID=2970906 RepID=UPI00190E93FB|nr:DUF262 domain-containing protein [Azospirillum argentinense]MBK3801831.1 DUF262 domain-containing protein [Azospirillum argentinense]